MISTNEEYYPNRDLCNKMTAIGFPITETYIARWRWPFLDEIHDDDPIDRIEYVLPNIPEMLHHIHTIEWLSNHEYSIRIAYIGQWKYNVEYERGFWPKYPFQDTLPNALAKMCIWLHENDFISFE